MSHHSGQSDRGAPRRPYSTASFRLELRFTETPYGLEARADLADALAVERSSFVRAGRHNEATALGEELLARFGDASERARSMRTGGVGRRSVREEVVERHPGGGLEEVCAKNVQIASVAEGPRGSV